VDMQILAGIKDDYHFFRTIIKAACTSLNLPNLDLESIEAQLTDQGPQELFESFLQRIEQIHPQKTVLFLLDEYELIEGKIRDGSLSESSIHYLAGALESPHKLSFIFTGSTNL
jgi:hypothetical protein